ncbi:hypothetical protein LTR66_011139 [Elasticomyces elasticus]|nr:hypothetical protein LTR66_011139 [Elasticomyces elasticus]KAK5011626.1 hypothetical protein LTR28_011462 [Elasticomyces elasticus]
MASKIEGWLELSEMQTFLMPLCKCSLMVQSQGVDGNHGVLHEVLTTLEHLLSEFEAAKLKQTYPSSSHFKACADKPAWRAQVVKDVNEAHAAAKKIYADEAVRISPRRDLSSFDAYNNLGYDDNDDELNR